MRRFGKFLIFGFIAIFTVCLFVFPETSKKAAYLGMIRCGGKVIPTLLPFLVVSGFVIRVVRPKSAILTALLTGLLGGYPAGAISASRLVGNGHCSREDAAKIAGVCSTASPGFIFGAANGNFSLFASCLIGCLAACFLCSRPSITKSRADFLAVSPISALTEALSSAVTGSAIICGYVIFFDVFIALFEEIGCFPNHPLFYGLFELTAGISRLDEIASFPFRRAAAALMLCSGGISAQLQCVSSLQAENIPLKPYFFRRLVASAAAAGCAAVLAFF